MAVNFGLLLDQPSLGQRFAQGEQEAQRNLLAQQQLQHTQQQNALAAMQMEEYKRGLTEQEGLRNYMRTLTPEQMYAPGTLATLATQYGKPGATLAQNLTASQKAQAELKKADVDAQIHRFNLQDSTLKRYNQELGAAPDRATAIEIIQRRANDPLLVGTPAAQVPVMAQVQRVPQDPEGFTAWKQQQAIGMAEWLKQNKPVVVQNTLMTPQGRVIATATPPEKQYEPSELQKTLDDLSKAPPGSPQARALQARVNMLTTREPREPREPSAPIAIEKDGKVVLVTREEALGQTPAAAMEALPPKEKQKREAALPQATAAVKGFATKADNFVKDLIALRDHPGLSQITGIAAGRLPGLTAQGRAAQALYDKVVAKGGFMALQDLRDASKTGGALGNVSNQEGKQLIASAAAVDRRQDAADVRAAINTWISDVQGAKTRTQEAYDATYAYKQGAPAAPPPPKSGATVSNW